MWLANKRLDLQLAKSEYSDVFRGKKCHLRGLLVKNDTARHVFQTNILQEMKIYLTLRTEVIKSLI